MSQRKLIRPDVVDQRSGRSVRRKQVPPEQTNAEEFYYLKQMAAKTPMVVVLTHGEELQGWIEWYDKGAIKLNRTNGPNLLIFKHDIRYMFKEEELRRFRKRAGRKMRAASRRPAAAEDPMSDSVAAGSAIDPSIDPSDDPSVGPSVDPSVDQTTE